MPVCVCDGSIVVTEPPIDPGGTAGMGGASGSTPKDTARLSGCHHSFSFITSRPGNSVLLLLLLHWQPHYQYMETNAAASNNINALLPVCQDFYLARLFHTNNQLARLKSRQTRWSVQHQAEPIRFIIDDRNSQRPNNTTVDFHS